MYTEGAVDKLLKALSNYLDETSKIIFGVSFYDLDGEKQEALLRHSADMFKTAADQLKGEA